MKQEIKIPQMGESVTEATIGAFLKKTGEMVAENDEIVELETEKVNQVLYAPIAGVINWTVKEGDSVKIGDVIGSVDSEQAGTAAPAESKEPEKPKEPKQPQAAEKPKEPEKPQQAKRAPGAGERIMTQAFVEELKQPAPTKEAEPKKISAAEGRETRHALSKIRKTIASRLVESLHSAAMLTTFNEVDMSEIMHLRAKHKESFVETHGVKLGLMSFFVKAVVEGLKAYPRLNSYLEGDEIVERHYYDIGIAVGAERGLVVPVLRDCDALTFPEIEKQIINYAQKAQGGRLAIEDLQGGGFTITNGGVYGSMLSTPILNPGQVGILGMHNIVKRAVVIDDEILVRPIMYLALSYDHRVVDGREAVSFLVHVKKVLEDPSRLLFVDGKI